MAAYTAGSLVVCELSVLGLAYLAKSYPGLVDSPREKKGISLASQFKLHGDRKRAEIAIINYRRAAFINPGLIYRNSIISSQSKPRSAVSCAEGQDGDTLHRENARVRGVHG
jgi:hypothetical protein